MSQCARLCLGSVVHSRIKLGKASCSEPCRHLQMETSLAFLFTTLPLKSLPCISHSGSCLHLSCCMHATPPTYAYNTHVCAYKAISLQQQDLYRAHASAGSGATAGATHCAHCMHNPRCCKRGLSYTPVSSRPHSLAALSHVKTRYTTRHALCGPKMCSTAALPVDQAAHDMSTCRICYLACPFRPKLCCVAASPSSIPLSALPHTPFLTALCGTPGTQQSCCIDFAAHAPPRTAA